MRILFDREIYEEFTETYLAKAARFIWIATANIKGTGLRYKNRFVSLADLMAILANKGVGFRIIHSELPSKPFRQRYDQLDTKGMLSANVEFLHCIRMHAKIFIVDGAVALVGSPNLTGAGIGAKGRDKRNFETAVLFEGEREAQPFVDYFDGIWMGSRCPACKRRDICPAPAT